VEGRCHVAEPNWIEKELKWSLVGHLFLLRVAQAMVHIWAVEQKQQFQTVARHFPGGLSTVLETQHNPRASCPGTFLCRKQSFGRRLLLTVAYTSVLTDHYFACFSQ